MAARKYFSHTGKDGRTMVERVKAEGYKGYSRLGENIAAGRPTAEETMADWMGSAGHKRNILDCKFNELGVGVARGGPYKIYWTQNFGTR